MGCAGWGAGTPVVGDVGAVEAWTTVVAAAPVSDAAILFEAAASTDGLEADGFVVSVTVLELEDPDSVKVAEVVIEPNTVFKAALLLV